MRMHCIIAIETVQIAREFDFSFSSEAVNTGNYFFLVLPEPLDHQKPVIIKDTSLQQSSLYEIPPDYPPGDFRRPRDATVDPFVRHQTMRCVNLMMNAGYSPMPIYRC